MWYRYLRFKRHEKCSDMLEISQNPASSQNLRYVADITNPGRVHSVTRSTCTRSWVNRRIDQRIHGLFFHLTIFQAVIPDSIRNPVFCFIFSDFWYLTADLCLSSFPLTPKKNSLIMPLFMSCFQVSINFLNADGWLRLDWARRRLKALLMSLFWGIWKFSS